MKYSFKREDIKYNTLAKEIFRIDFYQLDNFEKILESLEIYFKDKGYNYNQYTSANVTYNIDDPEPLITTSFMLRKDIETVQNYEFINENEFCKFIINQNMLIFDKNEFEGYKNIEYYFKLFLGAINTINEISEIKPSRLGIRKINELILPNKDSVIKYFNEFYLNDFKKIENDTKEFVLTYSFRPYYANDKLSLNKNIRITKGKFKITNEDISDAYSFIWDIDTYKRFDIGTDKFNGYNELCKSINEKIFEEYIDVISDDLYKILIGEEESKNILGGLKNGSI